MTGSADGPGGIHVDPDRLVRTGLPEVVWADGKTDEQLAAAVVALLAETGSVLVSRLDPGRVEVVTAAAGGRLLAHDAQARVALAGSPFARAGTGDDGGRVVVVTAGAADAPAAAEASATASALGCRVRVFADRGVAGLHRLAEPVDAIRAWPADVAVVVAGTDGALASVVSGLVACPVIGLPTSTGYGHGGRGEAALASMLQACTGGLLVVNVDAGVPAGLSAARIARRAADARAGA